MSEPARRSGPTAPGLAGWCGLDDVIDAIASSESPRVALAISGGGATGAYQAGVIRAYLTALARRGEAARKRLAPRIIVGTSAGALNATCLLVERLGMADDAVLGRGAEPYVSALWRVIGEKDRGARFVVGKRRWLIAVMTRWVRSPLVLAIAGTVLGLLLLAFVNPVLFGWLASLHGSALLEDLGGFLLEHSVAATLVSAALLAASILYVVTKARRALFGNDALRRTLANTVAAPARETNAEKRLLRPRSPAEENQVGQRIAAGWYAMGPDAPEFILSATDLSAKNESLFTLVGPDTYHRLAVERWQVVQIGRGLAPDPSRYYAPPMLENLCGAVSESYLLRCVVASTSIPGVFPSQRIPLYRVEDGAAITHDFVDGGVLNNAPVHIAIDAGATHVLSFELNPLLDRGPLHPSTSARGGEPRLVGNLVRTFETLLDMATDEDIRGAAAWNRRIRDAEQGGMGAVGLKKHVPIFRVAPVERRVDTIEFDGHYETIFGGASPGLVAWAEQGYTDSSARRLFWAATFEAFPEDPPPGP